MDLDRDVVWRTLRYTITHHQGVPSKVTLFTTVEENGIKRRQDESTYLMERPEDLLDAIAEETGQFLLASGDNGVRSLF